MCVCVRVPCIHQQRGCGTEDILIWRNVSHVFLLDDLREKEKEGEVRQKSPSWSRGARHISTKEKPSGVCDLTERVAPRCWTLHVEVVALVETSPLGSVGKVVCCGLFERQLLGQSLILLLWNYNIITRRHEVVAGARNFDIWLRGWGVACRSARWGLIPFCPLFQVCCANQDKENERK